MRLKVGLPDGGGACRLEEDMMTVIWFLRRAFGRINLSGRVLVRWVRDSGTKWILLK